MARKKTEIVTEAPKRPDFSLRMTDKDLYLTHLTFVGTIFLKRLGSLKAQIIL